MLRQTLESSFRSLISNFLLKIAELFSDFFQNFAKLARILLNFRQILTKFFRDFSNFSKTKHTANVCWAVPQAGRFSETFTGFCTRPICPLLASSCARPAAALRDLWRFTSRRWVAHHVRREEMVPPESLRYSAGRESAVCGPRPSLSWILDTWVISTERIIPRCSPSYMKAAVFTNPAGGKRVRRKSEKI